MSVRDRYTVIDIPVALSTARTASARVGWDADRQVAGFFVRAAEVVS